MKKILLVLFLSGLLLSSCSPPPETMTEGQAKSGPPDDEVSKIPTTVTESVEAGAVYLFNGNDREVLRSEDSPARFMPSLETISLKYIQAGKAAEILSKMMPEGVFAEGGRSSRLVIKCRTDEMTEAKRLLRQLDGKPPQIMIESRIVELTGSSLSSLGVSWANTAGGFKISADTLNGRLSADDITAVISAMVSKGEARMIANPKIAAADNTEASVNIGSRIPYAVPVNTASSASQWTVQYIDAGVSLKITPYIGSGGTISVLIKPEVSSVSEWRITPAGDFPVISTRNAETFVKVRDGETIIIGGLIDETDRENISKVPFAGDLPLIKELFSKRTDEMARTEVVFLITPRII